MSLHETRYEGEPALLYETAAVRMTILPHIGGKVISLVDRATQREWLWRQPGRPLRRPSYGDAYPQYDLSGWDECFPSIGPCLHPDPPWHDVGIPDHGELWSLPWATAPDGPDLVMWASGLRFPYRFERRFHPDGQALRILYTVTSAAAEPFRCLWSLHPFFAATPTLRILLPEGVRAYVDQSNDDRLGRQGTTHTWPLTGDTRGRTVDLSALGPADEGTIEKLFALGLTAGWVAAIDEATDDYIALTFNPHDLPSVGMAINRGAWPVDHPAFTAILEPCSGWPDHLSDAVVHGVCATLPPRGALHWQVVLHVGRGTARLQAVLKGTD